jgi:quinol monooxygenase YgiN
MFLRLPGFDDIFTAIESGMHIRCFFAENAYHHAPKGGVTMAATMFVKHRVNDYNSWKHEYDEIASVRKQKGVTAASVHRDPKDPNTVVVMHRFKDMNSAKGFADSGELKSAMTKAGVNGAPEFWFAEDVEHTPY